MTPSAEARGKAPSEADIKKLAEGIPTKATAKPKCERKMLVLNLCHDFYHNSIPLIDAALVMMGEKTGAYKATISSDLKDLNAENLKQYDAICLNNTTQLKIEDDQKAALLDFVKSGKGLIGIHAASDNFADWPEGAAMVGGLFDGHPWGGGGTWAVKIDEPNHPLNKSFGGKGFMCKEEIYKIKGAYSRDKMRVLVTLDMEHGVNKMGREDGDNAISWIQPVEKGRSFYSSFGHNNAVVQTPSILQHWLDGFQYALGDLKCDDSPSAKLDPQPKPALCPKKQSTGGLRIEMDK
jgi:type 1 glutamine amidotransferase